MLFTSENIVIFDFTWKKKITPKCGSVVGETGAPMPPSPLVSTPCKCSFSL